MQKTSFLKLPEEFPKKEEYDNLSGSQKGFFNENIIYKIFFLNKNKKEGITINDLKDNLYISRNSIIRVLTKLLASREIYCIEGRPKRYFKNGRISHHFLNSSIILDNRSYEFRLFTNEIGKISIFIKEKSNDLFSEEEYAGGIIIDADNFEEFVDALIDKTEKIKSEIKNFKKDLKKLID